MQDRAFVVARDDHGAIRVVAGLTIDTTVRREAEQALRDADSQKDAFLAMLGHELRNPLAPLRTATEVLRTPGADDDAREGARAVIARQVTHVSRLVDDLLDVSRLSRGRLVIRTDAVDLRRVVTETIEDYGRVLAEARLRLHVSLPEAPVWVHGDATRLAQILGNLLHNARKFTPSGGDVSVSLDLAADGSSVRLQVRDSGLGIEPALLPHIFEVFRQGGQTLDRSEGGLGLGLSLAKGLVELHGGTVAVESAGAGRGATFGVRLPAAGGVSPSAADWVVPRARGALRIVVIEDNADAAEMLRVLLEFQGHSVALAHGGREGIAAIDVERPDLVLCDIGLPGGLSGLDVAQAVRQAGGPVPYLVALTGYAGEEHVRKARAAGFDRHLAKPIGPGELDALVAHVWASRYGTIGPPASSGVAESDGTRPPLGRD